MTALFYAALIAKILSIPALAFAIVAVARRVIDPGPICTACLAGYHGELAEITEGVFKCDCACHAGRVR